MIHFMLQGTTDSSVVPHVMWYHKSKCDTSHICSIIDPSMVHFMSEDGCDDVDSNAYHHMTSHFTSSQ